MPSKPRRQNTRHRSNLPASQQLQRPNAARRRYWRIQATLIVLGIIYLALHCGVTYFAYLTAGTVPAIATFVSMGIGDVYWAWNWWDAEPYEYARAVAFNAAIMAWASWLARPWTGPALAKIALAAHKAEFASRDDIDQPPETERETSHQRYERKYGARPDRDRPGGAA